MLHYKYIRDTDVHNAVNQNMLHYKYIQDTDVHNAVNSDHTSI